MVKKNPTRLIAPPPPAAKKGKGRLYKKALVFQTGIICS